MKNTCLDNIHFKSEFLPVIDAYYNIDEEWNKDNRHFSFGNIIVDVMRFCNFPQSWKIYLYTNSRPQGGRWAWPELHAEEANWQCLVFLLPTDRAVLRFIRMMEKYIQTSPIRFNDIKSEFEYISAKVQRQCKQMGGIIESIERRWPILHSLHTERRYAQWQKSRNFPATTVKLLLSIVNV